MMTKQDLLQLENLLQKFEKDYGDEIHNDRYCELVGFTQTVNAIVLEGKYKK